jgi:hypothetical protein
LPPEKWVNIKKIGNKKSATYVALFLR